MGVIRGDTDYSVGEVKANRSNNLETLQEGCQMAEKSTMRAVNEALTNSKERNFTETIEIAVNLKDIDLSIPKNRINEEIILPHGRGSGVSDHRDCRDGCKSKGCS